MSNTLLIFNLSTGEILILLIVPILLLLIPFYAIKNYYNAKFLKQQNEELKERLERLERLEFKKE